MLSRRICALAQLEESVVLVAAVYLSRIMKNCPELPISSCTVHRLLLQAVAVGAKFSLDHPRSNKVMASFADLPPKKYNQCEVKFLCLIQYDLTVKPEDLEATKLMLGLMVKAPEEVNQSMPVYKKVKLGESACGVTTYSTIDAVMGTTEDESAVYSEESEVDAMSHLEENNNYPASDSDGVVTPTLSQCSNLDTMSVSPGWSGVSEGETTPDNNHSPVSNSVGNYPPVQGFLAKTETPQQSLEPNKMSTPERRAATSNLVAYAAE